MMEIELSRFILVVSVVVVAVEYFRSHRVTGGSLTPGYLSILILAHEWSLLISVAVFTLATFAVMRLVVMRWFPLTKAWIYGTGVLVSVLLHSIVRVSSNVVELPDAIGLVVAAGLFVTPGLIAYDLTAQGSRKTLTAITTVTAVTCLIALPVLLIGVIPDGPSGNPTGRIDPQWWWLAVATAVVATLALRMARGLATAGYIGAVFLIEIAWWDSLALLLGCVIATRLITRTVLPRSILTPRQSFQLAFMIGAIISWTTIYWTNEWGLVAAQRLEPFALEPLVVVGLLSADLVRTSAVRASIGVTSASAIVAAALLSTALDPWAIVVCLVGLFVIVVLLALPALTELFGSAPIAIATGREFRRTTLDADGVLGISADGSHDDGVATLAATERTSELRALIERRRVASLVVIARVLVLAGLTALGVWMVAPH